MRDFQFIIQPISWQGNPIVTTSTGTCSVEVLSKKANEKIQELHKLGAHVTQMSTCSYDGVLWAYLYFERVSEGR